MRNIEINPIKFSSNQAVEQAEYIAYLASLSDARLDERRNLAAVFSARLDAIAAFILHKDVGGRGAVEILRQEAERIQNEAWEIV